MSNDRRLPGYILCTNTWNRHKDEAAESPNMKVDARVSSMLLYAVTFLVQLTSVGGSSSSDAIPYTAHQDMTWAVMSNQLSNPSKQAEYDAFMEACRASAGGMAETYCNHDESFRIQMNSEQPRSVRCSVDDCVCPGGQCVDSPPFAFAMRCVCCYYTGAKLYRNWVFENQGPRGGLFSGKGILGKQQGGTNRGMEASQLVSQHVGCTNHYYSS
jgi:hypothetical protein